MPYAKWILGRRSDSAKQLGNHDHNPGKEGAVGLWTAAGEVGEAGKWEAGEGTIGRTGSCTERVSLGPGSLERRGCA